MQQDKAVLVLDHGAHTLHAVALEFANTSVNFVNRNIDTELNAMWRVIFNTVAEDVTNFPLLISVPVLQSKAVTATMGQVLFEQYQVPFLKITASAPLVMVAHNLQTGIVVDCGHLGTSVMGMVQGQYLYPTCVENDIAGDALTRHVANMLQVKYAVAEQIKIQVGQCNTSNNTSTEYKLPDGSMLHIDGKLQAAICEPLFQPSMINKSCPSIVQLLGDALAKVNPSEQRQYNLLGNIVTTGGTSLLPGFAQRLMELVQQEQGISLVDHCIKAVPSRKHSAWIGGAIQASIPANLQKFVSLQEYEESGPLLVQSQIYL